MSFFDQYSPFVIQQSNSLGVPPSIGLGLFQQESGFNPSAIGDNGAAIGIGQLHVGAASDVGVINRLDPYQSITGSLTYLKDQFNKFGNWTDALAAYNQGAGNFQNGLGYAQQVLNRAKQFLTGGGTLSDITSGAGCLTGDPAACASLAGGLLGGGDGCGTFDFICKLQKLGGGDGCGTFDFICKLQKWISQSEFFTRLALAALALLLVLGGLYLMKGKE